MDAREAHLIDDKYIADHLPLAADGYSVLNQGGVILFPNSDVLKHVWPRLQMGQQYVVFPQMRVVFTKRDDRSVTAQTVQTPQEPPVELPKPWETINAVRERVGLPPLPEEPGIESKGYDLDGDSTPFVQVGDDGKVTIEDGPQRNMIVLDEFGVSRLIDKLQWAQESLSALQAHTR